MVIFNALLGLILKLPSVYASIFDLVQFIHTLNSPTIESLLHSVFNLIIICSNDNTCFLMERFGNLFYLISLSIYLIFFYNFDKNFRISFLRIFNNDKKSTNKNSIKP